MNTLEIELTRMRHETIKGSALKIRIDALASLIQSKPADACLRITTAARPAQGTPIQIAGIVDALVLEGHGGSTFRTKASAESYLLHKYDHQTLLKCREEYIRDMTREGGMLIGGELMDVKEADNLLAVHRRYFASIIEAEVRRTSQRPTDEKNEALRAASAPNNSKERCRTAEEMVEEALLWCPLVSGRTHSMTLAWFVALCSRNSSPFCFSGNRAKATEWKPISLDVQYLRSQTPCLRIIGLLRPSLSYPYYLVNTRAESRDD